MGQVTRSIVARRSGGSSRSTCTVVAGRGESRKAPHFAFFFVWFWDNSAVQGFRSRQNNASLSASASAAECLAVRTPDFKQADPRDGSAGKGMERAK